MTKQNFTLARIKEEAKTIANDFFHEQAEIDKKYVATCELCFSKIALIIDDEYRSDEYYEVHYEIRAGKNQAIPLYQLIFEFSESGELLDDFYLKAK